MNDDYWDITNELAGEINWDLSNMHLYYIAQITPMLDRIVAQLTEAGQGELAQSLDQFLIDVGFQIMEGLEELDERETGPDTEKLRTNVQPVKIERLAILLQVATKVDDEELAAYLSALTKSMMSSPPGSNTGFNPPAPFP